MAASKITVQEWIEHAEAMALDLVARPRSRCNRIVELVRKVSPEYGAILAEKVRQLLEKPPESSRDQAGQ